MPKISVIMPLYNTEEYVEEAVWSILNQTYGDFELLIIDDASTDDSLVKVKLIEDSRIKIIEKPVNTGYTDSLNMGIEMAQGDYIARMDSDDIAYPTRFESQVHLLDTNPSIGISGTWFEELSGPLWTIEHPKENNAIKIGLLETCVLGHPTVMFRKDIIVRHHLKYDKSFEPAEDYHLWARMGAYCEFANVPIVLLKYRWHENQISQRKADIQKSSADKTRIMQLENIGIIATEKEQAMHLALIHKIPFQYQNPFTFLELHNWLIKLMDANRNRKFYDQKLLKEFLLEKWEHAFRYNYNYNLGFLKFALFAQLPTLSLLEGSTNKLKFVMKSLMKWNSRI